MFIPIISPLYIPNRIARFLLCIVILSNLIIICTPMTSQKNWADVTLTSVFHHVPHQPNPNLEDHPRNGSSKGQASPSTWAVPRSVPLPAPPWGAAPQAAQRWRRCSSNASGGWWPRRGMASLGLGGKGYGLLNFTNQVRWST